MAKKKRKKKPNIFRYLKFGNLYKEIERYGYRYDMKSYLKSYVISLVAVLGVGVAFRLHPIAIVFLGMIMFLSVPKIILNQFRFVYEQDRFEDSTSYMESLIYSFRKNGKILESLRDIRELSNDRIRGYIDKVIQSINQSNDINMYESSLAIIEEEYGSLRMKSLHNFLIKAEAIGGNYNRSLNILIKDLKEWNKNTYLMQQERKQIKTGVTMAIAMSLVVSCMMFRLLPTTFGDISNDLVYQVSSVALLLLCFGIFFFTQTKCVCSWLKNEETVNEEKILRDKNKALYLDIKKAQKKANIIILLTVPCLLYALYLKNMPMVVALAFMVFILNGQAKRSKRSAKKRVEREIDKSFPTWLREMALSLQTENVYNAIQNSIPTAPAVFRDDLQKVLDRIDDTPNSIVPYQSFLKEFDVMDVRSAFSMFYSLTLADDDSADIQINEIIERNVELSNKAEKLAEEDAIAVLKLVALVPMIITSLKMFVDLYLFMMMIMTFMNSAV